MAATSVQAIEPNRPANLFLNARIDIRISAARVAAVTLLHIESAPWFAANAAGRKRGVVGLRMLK